MSTHRVVHENGTVGCIARHRVVLYGIQRRHQEGRVKEGGAHQSGALKRISDVNVQLQAGWRCLLEDG